MPNIAKTDYPFTAGAKPKTDLVIALDADGNVNPDPGAAIPAIAGQDG